MTTYLATTELTFPSWWTKFLRWLHIKPKRNEFKVSLGYNELLPGQLLNTGDGVQIMILRKIG